MKPGVNQRQKKILLIDDEDSFRRVLADTLGKRGFEIQQAAQGKQGVRLAAEMLPDLILCDLTMPEMTGYEVLAALRQEDRLASIPVIFLTAQAAPAEVRLGMNLGADDYLTKPVNLADLLGAIQARLNRQQELQQRQREPAPADSASSGSFLLKTSTEKRLVKFSEIRSILAYGEYSWVYWDKNQKGTMLRKPLKQWQSELPVAQFVRVHRRAIVNLEFLERVERLSSGRLQVHLRDTPEPILVSLGQTPVLNRKLTARQV